MKKKRSRQAVTPIIGTSLLLAMAISLFAVLNIIVFSFPQEPRSPSVNLVGTVENGNLYVDHLGGESLKPETQIIITIGNTHYNEVIGSFTGGNSFSFGETIEYIPGEDIKNKHVAVTIVDVNSNSIILTAVLQRGGT